MTNKEEHGTQEAQKAIETGLEQLGLFNQPTPEEEAAAAIVAQEAENKHVIRFDLPPVDPKLDPNSPEFDFEAWKAEVDKMGGFDSASKRLKERMVGIMQAITAPVDTGTMTELAQTALLGMTEQMESTISAMRDAMASIVRFIQSDTFEAIKTSVREIGEFIEENQDAIEAAAGLKDLAPFLQAELEEMKKDPQFAECTLDDIIGSSFDADGNPIASPFEEAIARAKAAKEKYEQERELTEFAATIEDNLPALQSILPSRHTMPNNALMNALQQKQTINAGAFDLVVANAAKKRKEITAYTMITYDEQAEETALTATHLSEYERQVSDAVITLWIEARKQNLPPVFTTDMVFRAMPGGGDKPSQQQRGAITRAIEKMRRLHITVDATEEMRTRGIIGDNEKCEFDDFYLSAVGVTRRIKNGGQTVKAYKLHAEPVILTYSRMTKQILEVNAKHIEVRKVKQGHACEIMPMTAGRQAMTGYMLRRISVMKRDKEKAQEALRNYNKKRSKDNTLPEQPIAAFRQQSPVILFSTLFTEAGTATTDRKQTMLNRQFCFEVLDYWKITGLITDYRQQKKGKSITGVEICL